MNQIFYEEEELINIATGVRVSISNIKQFQMPYSIIYPEDFYFKYISKYKSDIMKFLPFSYMGFKHSHRDTYIHFSTLDNLINIQKSGVLKKEFANENGSLGAAIYTYPLKSGMYFYNKNLKDSGFLIFETEAEHVHITQTDDSPLCIGEADFFCDEISIENSKILTYEEMEYMSKKFFDWKEAQKHYFGLEVIENADYKSMYQILEHYNYDFHNMKKGTSI